MTEIEISGSTKNLKTLFDALALPRSNKSSGRGDNLEFPYRKVAIKSNIFLARQVNASVYSQVICRQDVETSFIKTKGECDITFDMTKALRFLRELGTYENVSIIHDTELQQTTFRGMGEKDCEEWYTFEPSHEIDDGRNEIQSKCTCTDPKACVLCKGRGIVPSMPLSYKNQNGVIFPLDASPYQNVGVQFEIDTSIMRMIGDKTENLLDNMYPFQFNKDHLLVFAGDPKDISNDSFKKQIPMNYIINKMVGKIVILGTDFRNIFGSLEGKVMLFSEDAPEKEQSIYISKNEMGFHSGIKMMAKSRDV